jgi:hypothetical protein
MDLLWVVVVSCAGAHVVCICVYLRMKLEEIDKSVGNGDLQYIGAGSETERVQRAYT